MNQSYTGVHVDLFNHVSLESDVPKHTHIYTLQSEDGAYSSGDVRTSIMRLLFGLIYCSVYFFRFIIKRNEGLQADGHQKR